MNVRDHKRANRLSRDFVHFVSHEQVCSRTIKYQVYQYETSMDISEQSVSKLQTVLQQIQFLLLLWISGRQSMVLRLCVAVELFCSPFRNIFPHISLRDLPCHRTTMKYSHPISRKRVVFHNSCRNPWFEHISVIVYNILAYLTFSLSTAQINMVKEWCRLSQINVFHGYFSHCVKILFLSSQFEIVHKTLIRVVLFVG